MTNLTDLTVDSLTATAATLTAATIGNQTFGASFDSESTQTVTAAGATQGGATAITKSVAIITVALTASTKGVLLPASVTGRKVTIVNAATFGVKQYPPTNGKLGASATNAAIVLAINKTTVWRCVGGSRWIAQTGA